MRRVLPYLMLAAACGDAPVEGTPTTDAGDLTTGTLDPARLPNEAVTEAELAAALDALPGTSPTTDADDLTTGTLDPARLPPDVVTEAELTAALDGLPGPTTDAGDLTAGTLDPARLPADAVTEAELTAALNALPGPTTDAGDLTAGTLDPERLPDGVVFEGDHGAFGTQVVGFDDPLALDSNASIELLAIEIETARATGVVVNAHAILEKPANDQGRYLLEIRPGTCQQTAIATGLWRAAESATSPFQATTIAVTGFIPSVNGVRRIALCARKLTSGEPDATVYARGLTATW